MLKYIKYVCNFLFFIQFFSPFFRFFEWKRDQAKKQPYFIYFPDKKDTDERETNSSCLKVKKEENGVSVKSERDSNLGIVKEEKENLEQEGGSECPADTSSLNPADVLLKKEIKTEFNGTDIDHQAHKGQQLSSIS